MKQADRKTLLAFLEKVNGEVNNLTYLGGISPEHGPFELPPFNWEKQEQKFLYGENRVGESVHLYRVQKITQILYVGDFVDWTVTQERKSFGGNVSVFSLDSFKFENRTLDLVDLSELFTGMLQINESTYAKQAKRFSMAFAEQLQLGGKPKYFFSRTDDSIDFPNH